MYEFVENLAWYEFFQNSPNIHERVGRNLRNARNLVLAETSPFCFGRNHARN